MTGFGAPQATSVETGALRQINSSSQTFVNRDFVKNISWLNQSVDTLSAYTQKLQSGVDSANENVIDQIQGLVSDIFVLLVGGEPTGIDLGDLGYVLQGIGALLGINPNTPFPLNLFEAAGNLFDNFIAPLDQFADLVLEAIEAWAETLGFSDEAVDSIQEFNDAVVSFYNGIGDTFGIFGDMFSSIFRAFGIGTGVTDISGLQGFWDAITGFLDNILEGPHDLLMNILSNIVVFAFKGMTWLVNVINPSNLLNATGMRFIGPQIVPDVSSKTTDWSVGSNPSISWVFDDVVTHANSDQINSGVNTGWWTVPYYTVDSSLGSFKALGNGVAKRVLAQEITPCITGEEYLVSGYMKWDSIPTDKNTVGPCIVFYFGANEISQTNINIDAGHTATGGWEKLSQVIVVPQNVDGFKIGCRISTEINSGTVWIDDLSCTGEQTLGAGLAQGILNFPRLLVSSIIDYIDGIVQFFFGENNILSKVLSSIIPGLDATVIVTGQFAQDMVQGLGTALGNIWDAVNGAIDGLGQLINDLWYDPIGTIGQLGQDMITGLGTALSDLGTGINNTIDSLGDLISDLWNNPAEVIANLIASMIPGLDASKILSGQFAQDMISGLGSALSDLGSGINDIIQNLGDLIHDLWHNPFNVIANLLAAMIPALDASKITSGQYAMEMIAGLTDALSNLGDFINDVIDAIESAFRGIPIVGSGIANMINGLQGFFNGLFGQPTPAATIQAPAVPALDASKITTGEVAAQRIASLDAAKITTGTFGTTRIADGAITNAKVNDLAGEKVTTGSVAAARIAALDASKITTGTLSTATIPSLDAAKITTGTLSNASMIPVLDASKVTTGNFSQDRVTNLTGDLSTALSTGVNLTPNPGSENANFPLYQSHHITTTAEYSTEFKRSGSRSVKLIGLTGVNVDHHFFRTNTLTYVNLPVQEGDSFYFEAWIKGGTGNTKTAGAIRPYLWTGDPAAPTMTYPANIAAYSGDLATLNAGWNKLSGYYTVPAGGVALQVVVQLHTSAGTGCILHVDDMMAFRVTEAVKTNQALYAANIPSTTIIANSVPALDGSKITTGTIGTAIVPNLDASKITTGTIGTAIVPNLDAGKITTGAIPAARIGSLPTSQITSGTFGSGFIADSAVTNAKLGADISGDKIVAGTVVAGRIGALDASKITTGTIGTAIVPNLDASKITTGTLGTAIVPNLDAAKITTGTLGTTQIPSLDAAKITTGALADARIPELAQSKITNLGTDLTNIDTKSTQAQAAIASKAAGNNNLVFDPDCSRADMWPVAFGTHFSFLISTEQFRSSPSSLKITRNGAATYPYIPAFYDGNKNVITHHVKPGDVYYACYWVRAHASNVNTQSCYIQFSSTDSTGQIAYHWTNHGSALPNSTGWTKIEGYYTVPAGYDRLTCIFGIGGSGSVIGDSYYLDDMLISNVTESNVINKALYNANTPSANVLSSVVPSLDASKITTGTIGAAIVPNLDATKITTGTVPAARIGSLPTSQITSGTFGSTFIADSAITDAKVATGLSGGKITTGSVGASYIAALDASKITTGTLGTGIIPTLDQSKITNLTTDLSSITTGSSNTINYLYDAFDGTTGNTGKTISDMRTRGAAVRTSAVNAKTLADIKMTAGQNLVSNPGFENTTFWTFNGTSYDTSVKRSGARSLKITSNGGYINPPMFVNQDSDVYIDVVPGNIYYFEAWIFGNNANPGTTETAWGWQITYLKSDNSSLAVWLGGTTSVNLCRNAWTKSAVYYTIPADVVKIKAYGVSLVPTGNSFWVDDCLVKDVTESVLTNQALYSANTPAANVLSSVVPSLDASKITTGTFGNALIASGLDAAKLTTGTMPVARIAANAITNAYLGSDINGTKITAGTVGANYVAPLDASKVTTGTFATSFIPALDVAKITTGTFGSTFIPSLDGSKITTGSVAAARIANLAQSQITNLPTDLTTIDTKAVVAKNIATTALQSGPNLATNPGFENTNLFIWTDANRYFSTEQKRSGTQSWKTIGAKWASLFSNETAYTPLPCTDSDRFYAEIWVYGKADNPAANNGATMHVQTWNSAGTLLQTTYFPAYFSTATLDAARGVWTKMSGYFTPAAGAVSFQITHIVDATNITLYWDDFACYRVTESVLTNQALYGANTAASTVIANAVPALDASKISTGSFSQNQITSLTTDLSNRVDFTTYNSLVSGGENICTNPGFEDTSQYIRDATYVTNVKYSGIYSAKLTSAGAGGERYISLVSNKTTTVYVKGVPSQRFYVEFNVYGDDANTYFTGTTAFIGFGIWSYDKTTAYVTNTGAYLTADQVGKGAWVKYSGIIQIASTSTIAFHYPVIRVTTTAPAGNSWYFDDIVMRNVTDVANVNTALYGTNTPGVSVLSSAVPSLDGTKITTGSVAAARIANLAQSQITNLPTDLTTINTTATKTKSLVTSKFTANQNLVVDSTCDNLNLYASGDYSTDFAYTGTRSIKLVGGASTHTHHLVVDDVTTVDIPCVPGDVFYCEYYVRGATTNTTNSAVFYMNVYGRNATKTSGYWHYPGGVLTGSTSYNNVWTKISGYVTVPAGMYFVRVAVIAEAGVGTYYFDEAKMYRVSEANAINQKLYAANDPATTIVTGAVPSLDGTKITTGSVAAARIADLDAGKVTTGAFGTARIPNLPGTIINSGTVGASYIPALDTTKITTGTFSNAMIASGLDAAKLTTGTMPVARIGASAITNAYLGSDINGTKITAGTVGATYVAALDASKITTGAFPQSQVTSLSTDLGNRVDYSAYLAFLSGGAANLATNPSFEDTTQFLWSATANTNATYIRSGTRSACLTANGAYQYLGLTTNKTGEIYIQGGPSEKYYFEFYVKGDATNGSGTATAIAMGIWTMNTAKAGLSSVAAGHTSLDAIGTANWVKISGYITVPSDATTAFHRPIIFLPSTPAGKFYIDDVTFEKVTATTAINTALYNANTPASTVLANVVPALDAAKITTGSFTNAQIASGLDAAKLTTGTLPIARIGTGAVTNTYLGSDINGTKITAGTVGSNYVAALDASKITTGSFPQTQVTNLTTDFNNTWNSVVSGLQRTPSSGNTTTDVESVANAIAQALQNNSSAISAMQSESSGGAATGTSATINFSSYANATTLATPGFTQTYSGSGTGTWQIVDGLAKWVDGSNASRSCVARYNTKTTETDYQIVSFIGGGGQENNGSGTYSANYLYGRMNSAGTVYVYAKISGTTITLGFVNGSNTVWGTYTNSWVPLYLAVASPIELHCGTQAGERYYKVTIAGTPVITHTEVGTSSALGATYRYTGMGIDEIYSGSQLAPAPIATFGMQDNPPINYLGSGFRACRTATGTSNFATSYNLFPNSFLDTLTYATDDYTWDAATNCKVTVGVSGWYQVNVGFGMPINTMMTEVAPVVYKNGSIFSRGTSVWGVTSIINRSGSSCQSSFNLYLEAGDYIQPGYWQTTAYGASGSMNGEASGITTYFEVTLVNRSFS